MLGNEKGYTMTEMVIVLVLLAMLAMTGISLFFNPSHYNTRVFYDELLNSVKYARKLAVAQGARIQIDLTATTFTLRQRTEGLNCTTGTTFQPVVVPSSRATTYVKTAPSGVTLSPLLSFYFDPLGRAFQVSGTSACPLITSITVNVQGGGVTNTMTLTGETGFVQGAL
jgi:MSHA pilin protein MshC